MWAGPTTEGQVVELHVGFSLRGTEQARENLATDRGTGPAAFEERRALTASAWQDDLGRIEVDCPDEARRTVFATALYHSLLKPCLAPDESPFWPTGGPFAFDISTMWDIYRTQLPLLTTFWPERAADLATSLLRICEEEGNFPIGYRMARGADRFSRQASALAQVFLADLCALECGLDWDWALVHMHNDLRRTYGEDYLLTGVAHPISHTLDLAYGYWCTERVARRVGDADLADELAVLATGWRNAFDPQTGLLLDSTYYEGGRWNYSFRLVHDMSGRIALAGGDDAFVALLDRFFGYGADAVVQPAQRPGVEEMTAGYALGRFEGLNNEPDMEAPWAYHYAGRPDRTAEVVHAAVHQRFGTGPGGLPGNDDSGGLSSWYVWASLGLFPVAGQSLFLVNAPSFVESRLHVPGGILTIETTGFVEPGPGSPPQHVQAAWLDGRPLDRTWLPASRVREGGRLLIELGPAPSGWGTAPADRPPSYPPQHDPTTRETP
nr:glycoside hydrolase domain-containing protein [Cellulosimicrobium arenosum]